MSSFLLFISLLAALFLLSQLLQKELSTILYRITRSKKMTITLLALLFFPGTFIHELAHYLAAHLLFVPTGSMTLMPKVTGEHVALGSVEIAKTDPFRRLLIGAAPFLAGTSLILATLSLSEQYQLWGHVGYSILIIYILFELGNTMFSSRKDMEGVLLVLLLVTVLAVLLTLVGFHLREALITLFDDDSLRHIFQKGSRYLLYPLGINLSIVLLLKILQRLKK